MFPSGLCKVALPKLQGMRELVGKACEALRRHNGKPKSHFTKRIKIHPILFTFHDGSVQEIAAMQDRIHFISRQGKQILFVDLSACSPAEVEKIARIVPDCVMAQPSASVRMLVDFTGAAVDRAALQTMKVSAVFDKPYIKASAWIGAKALNEVYCEELRSFSRREFPVFKTRPEALAWLVKE
jgi:hypothetical protein